VEDRGITFLELVLQSINEAIDRLVAQKKDVERGLIDLKAQTSLYEDEIRNAIKSGRKYLEDISGHETKSEDIDGFLDAMNESTHDMSHFVDSIARRRAMLDKNHEFEITLEALRARLTESIDGLETLKSLLIQKGEKAGDKRVRALKSNAKQAALGSSAIIRSQEMERQRIAREIHDGPAQAIANVVLRIDIAKKIFEQNPDTVPVELAKMKELAQNSLNEIRGFIFDLRPMTLQDLGLAATIKRVINSRDSNIETDIQFIVEGEERELHPDLKLAIFRIAQEALNNMRKYSKARHCWAHLKYFPDKVILLVEDDGKGFDENQIEDSQRKYTSFGILGMRERADDIGASLEIRSALGEGTKITLVVIDTVRPSNPEE
jgi:two-component system sensor histidine kinase DegS